MHRRLRRHNAAGIIRDCEKQPLLRGDFQKFFCRSVFHGAEEFLIVLGFFHSVNQEFHSLDRVHLSEEFAQDPDLGQDLGNQQKFLLAREISRGPDIIVASEPTHGLDVGATEYIRKQLIDLRDSGKAVLLVSTDLDEIMQLSDRIAVMYEGKVVAEGPAENFTLDRLGLLMGGIVGG